MLAVAVAVATTGADLVDQALVVTVVVVSMVAKEAVLCWGHRVGLLALLTLAAEVAVLAGS